MEGCLCAAGRMRQAGSGTKRGDLAAVVVGVEPLVPT
jgi:hypothetical protein